MNFVRVTTFRRRIASSVRHFSLVGPEMLNYILLDSVRALPLRLIIYFAVLLFFLAARTPLLSQQSFSPSSPINRAPLRSEEKNAALATLDLYTGGWVITLSNRNYQQRAERAILRAAWKISIVLAELINPLFSAASGVCLRALFFS
jgi:hypothetical protein